MIRLKKKGEINNEKHIYPDPYFLGGHEAVPPGELLHRVVPDNARVLFRKKSEKRKDKNKIRWEGGLQNKEIL